MRQLYLPLAAALISMSIASANAQEAEIAIAPSGGSTDFSWGSPYAIPLACIGGNLFYMFHVANVEQRKWTRMDQEAMNYGCFAPGIGQAIARTKWKGKKPEYMHNDTR